MGTLRILTRCPPGRTRDMCCPCRWCKPKCRHAGDEVEVCLDSPTGGFHLDAELWEQSAAVMPQPMVEMILGALERSS